MSQLGVAYGQQATFQWEGDDARMSALCSSPCSRSLRVHFSLLAAIEAGRHATAMGTKRRIGRVQDWDRT